MAQLQGMDDFKGIIFYDILGQAPPKALYEMRFCLRAWRTSLGLIEASRNHPVLEDHYKSSSSSLPEVATSLLLLLLLLLLLADSSEVFLRGQPTG